MVAAGGGFGMACGGQNAECHAYNHNNVIQLAMPPEAPTLGDKQCVMMAQKRLDNTEKYARTAVSPASRWEAVTPRHSACSVYCAAHSGRDSILLPATFSILQHIAVSSHGSLEDSSFRHLKYERSMYAYFLSRNLMRVHTDSASTGNALLTIIIIQRHESVCPDISNCRSLYMSLMVSTHA
ncbi:hypothetical protein CAPTEDRAFT_209624 [Capitella teleta]|uniref:Uncharacterized protein n=1 Tax=Capitella teleta TaxID=283909 RepID=R7TG88_CAPTE|nr:hypothetical protein CAPTEDRAFT_209624 [Capitella teleta]|eukprot:ELT90571.1 hypothetical protein CAPTEDRAFT_209624 [Capitella teleta]